MYMKRYEELHGDIIHIPQVFERGERDWLNRDQHV